MCTSRPSAPRIVYTGPSKAELAAQQAQLEEYRKQSLAMQQSMAAQIQAQIEAVNAATKKREAELAELAAQQTVKVGGKDPATLGKSPLATEVPRNDTPVKKPTTSTLRIDQATTPTTAGSGVNIGV
jgi:hypothetical protein